MILRRLAVVVFGLMVGLLLAEVGLRVAAPIPAEDLLPLPYDRSGLERIAAGETYIAFDSTLGWTVAPNATGVAPKGTYRSNAAGLRASHEYVTAPPESGPRLAAFGDSFTHCDDVDNDACWTAQLEEAVPGAEVMNFGVSGFAPDQAWLRYQRDGRAYQPCAVLIGYMIENVNRVVNRFRPFYQPDTGITLGKPRFVVRDGGLDLLPIPAPVRLRLRRSGLGRARIRARRLLVLPGAVRRQHPRRLAVRHGWAARQPTSGSSRRCGTTTTRPATLAGPTRRRRRDWTWPRAY